MLSVRNVQVFRQEYPIFEPISFDLKSGEAVHLVASNGVGKSTLMKAFLGHASFSGQITWQGALLSDQLHDVFMLPHGDILLSHLTVSQQLEYWSVFFRESVSEEILGFLGACGLMTYFGAPIQHLSEGQMRKLALSSLMFSFRPLWILDEPLTALDKESQQIFLERAKGYLGKGGGIVVASHQALPSFFTKIPLVALC
jgi:heme exporter protein A